MEDKELQELEEFSLEDIIKEFSDHPAVELEEEEEAPVSETAAEEEIPAEPAPVAEETIEEPAVEEELPETNAFPVIEEVCEEESVEEPAVEADLSETKAFPVLEDAAEENTDMSSETIRLDSSELLKGVVHDAKPIADEEETAETAAAEEEKPAYTKDWEPEYEQPMG